MMRRSVDLPAPLAPTTPILAPWKNESQMPRKISRLGGTTLRRSFITYAYSPAIAVDFLSPWNRAIRPRRPPPLYCNGPDLRHRRLVAHPNRPGAISVSAPRLRESPAG